MRVGMVLTCGGMLSLLWIGSARAQDKPPLPDPPVFSRLFTQPTGQNGYEDWVQGGDLIRDNKLVDTATEGGATLTFKRRVLADPSVQKALHLLREGLNKPAQSPHLVLDENTLLPELAPFRRLARLLSTEIYVRFADGRTDAALDSLQDGLRFGYRTQTNTIISGLVGVAIDAIVLREFSSHLDQLSEYQCSRLQRIVEEWLDWPSPVAFLLNGEKQFALRTLEAKRANPQALKDLLALTDVEDPNAPTTQALFAKLTVYLDSRPADLGQVIEHAETLIRAHYDAALVNLKLPIRERRPMAVISDKSLGGDLFVSLVVNTDQITDKYDRMEAMLRMLGVHAAIRGYRWEHGFLPTSLADLHLGKLIVDPFTGGDLMYQRSGKSYDLYSRGPFERDDNGQPTSTPPPPLKLQTSN
jgi:hypothetical protein